MSWIHDLPDDSWVRPLDARDAYCIGCGTYSSWRARGLVRTNGRMGPASRIHLGDFRACVAKRGDRPDDFLEPVPAGQCTHLGCTEPAEDDSPIQMCATHTTPLATKRERLRGSRCIQCQATLPRQNRGLYCQPCGVSVSRKAPHRQVAA